MSEEIGLESIRDCLEGGVPAPLATCALDGTLNISYIQQVQYLDSERVGTSRQAFNRALQALPASPFSQALIFCPRTGEQYRLDLQYLHTDIHGEAFEAMRANLDAIASQMRIGPAFRLRGLDVHRVLRCTRLARERQIPAPTRDQLAPIQELARRLERSTTYQETSQELLDALDDLLDIPYAILFTLDSAAGRLRATAGSGEARAIVDTTVELGIGLAGTAAKRRRPIVTTNLQRSRGLGETVIGNADHNVALGTLPGLPDARNAAAVPLILGDDLIGVLYLESRRPGAFGGPTEALLHIIGAYTAAALAARAESAPRQPASTPTAPEARGRPRLQLVYYQADDTVLCDSAYLVKGAPGRILWAMLTSHADSGRTQFTNRELRLDESLGLPAGNDNLEARLLVLRRRLADVDCGVTLERVGRGQLELKLDGPAKLTVVPTTGPMRSAHATPA